MTSYYWCVEYIASFIECFMSFVFCSSFLKNSNSHINKYYNIAVGSGLAFLVILLGNLKLFSSVNTVIIFLLITAVQWCTYKANIFKTLGIMIFYYAVMFIVDLIMASLLAIIQDVSISNLFSCFSFGRVVASLASKVILIIVCTMINKLAGKTKSLNSRAALMISITSVMIVLISSIMYLTQAKSNSNNINFIMLLFFIIMLVLVLTVYISIIEFFDFQQKKRELELIELKNISLERSLDDLKNTFSMWRKSVHDYKNTILAMDSLMDQGKIDELSIYIKNEMVGFEHKAGYICTGNTTVDTIINAKYSTAKSKGISFTVNAVMPEKCTMSNIHLAAVIGNLMDNAIEASKNENTPYIHIQISVVKSFLIIKITNSYSRKSISQGTTKKNKLLHGIGLKSVQSIVKEYNGDFSLELVDGEVIATVMIPF